MENVHTHPPLSIEDERSGRVVPPRYVVERFVKWIQPQMMPSIRSTHSQRWRIIKREADKEICGFKGRTEVLWGSKSESTLTSIERCLRGHTTIIIVRHAHNHTRTDRALTKITNSHICRRVRASILPARVRT